MTEQTTEPRGGLPAGGTWERIAKAGDRPTTPWALAKLVLVVGAVTVMLWRYGGLGALVFVVALGLMIMLHEAGHFVAAKLGGMKVTEFFLGFGPRLWSFRRGETEYGIKALPLGGYVKIIGMSNLEAVDPVDEPRTYRQATFPRRFAVAVAGSTVHMVLAFALLASMFGLVGNIAVREESIVGTLLSSSQLGGIENPAAAAGLRTGDRIVAINDKPVSSWAQVRKAIMSSPRKPLRFDVTRNEVAKTITITPLLRPKGRTGFIGISPATRTIRHGPIKTARLAFTAQRQTIGETIGALGAFFTPSNLKRYGGQFDRKDDTSPAGTAESPSGDDQRFLSPVGAVRLGTKAFYEGPWELLSILALINISVGVLNMIPLLPLDGGHTVIAIYERVRSRRGRRYRADVMKMLPVAWAVVSILLAVGLSSFYLDVVKPIDDPFREVPEKVTK